MLLTTLSVCEPTRVRMMHFKDGEENCRNCKKVLHLMILQPLDSSLFSAWIPPKAITPHFSGANLIITQNTSHTVCSDEWHMADWADIFRAYSHLPQLSFPGRSHQGHVAILHCNSAKEGKPRAFPVTIIAVILPFFSHLTLPQLCILFLLHVVN